MGKVVTSQGDSVFLPFGKNHASYLNLVSSPLFTDIQESWSRPGSETT